MRNCLSVLLSPNKRCTEVLPIVETHILIGHMIQATCFVKLVIVVSSCLRRGRAQWKQGNNHNPEFDHPLHGNSLSRAPCKQTQPFSLSSFGFSSRHFTNIRITPSRLVSPATQ